MNARSSTRGAAIMLVPAPCSEIEHLYKLPSLRAASAALLSVEHAEGGGRPRRLADIEPGPVWQADRPTRLHRRVVGPRRGSRAYLVYDAADPRGKWRRGCKQP